MRGEIPERGRAYAALLGRRHGLAREREPGAGALLDLHEGDNAAALGDYVYLPAAAGVVHGGDMPAPVPEVGGAPGLGLAAHQLIAVHQCIFLRNFARCSAQGPSSRSAA